MGRRAAQDRGRGRRARSTLPGGGAATLLAPYADSPRLWVARLDLPEPVLDYLHRWGRPIAYPYVRDDWPLELYQTVYAREPGSAEMPSAGRAFSPDVLERLAHAGIGFATLTLHTGVASLEGHEPPYDEAYAVPPATADGGAGGQGDRRPGDRRRHDRRAGARERRRRRGPGHRQPGAGPTWSSRPSAACGSSTGC